MENEWVLLDFKLEHQRRTLWTGWGELPLFPIGDPPESTDTETIVVTRESQDLDDFLSHHEEKSDVTDVVNPSTEIKSNFSKSDDTAHSGAAVVHSWIQEMTRAWFPGIHRNAKPDGEHWVAEAPKQPQSIAAFRVAAASCPAQVPAPIRSNLFRSRRASRAREECERRGRGARNRFGKRGGGSEREGGGGSGGVAVGPTGTI